MIPGATTSISLLGSTLQREAPITVGLKPVDSGVAETEEVKEEASTGDATGRSQLVVFVLWLT